MALDDEFVEEIAYLEEKARPVSLRKFDPTPYQDRVPNSLDYLWRKFGVSNWAENSFQLVDPATYTSVMQDLLKGNRFIQADDVVPYSITAFGYMRIWHRKFGHININFPKSQIFFSKKPIEELTGRFREINLTVTIPEQIVGDHYDLLSACVAKFGPIKEAEIYGFVPALALGGVADIKNVEKLRAPEHLSLLSQLTSFGTYYCDQSTSRGSLVEME